MQCSALTPDRRRCANSALDASRFCAMHVERDVGARDENPNGRRLVSLVAQVRRAFQPPIYDGGRYSVPAALNDAPTSVLIEHLKGHPDSMVRWMAAFVLRKRRAADAVDALWDAVKTDEIRFVRQQCAVALGKIGTPVVFAPLVEALNHDPDQGVRQACAIALGNLGYPTAMDEIARALEREENIFVKWDCIVALGQLGDTRVEKLLLRLQAEEIAQVIRDACRDSLSEIRQRNRATA
jgi:HEAT repeat protein